MDIHGDLDLRQNGLRNAVLPPELNFPAVPKPGLLVFKDKVLYICTDTVDGLPVWVPMTKPLQMVRFTQATPQIEWQITHGLNMNTVFVQVYDDQGKWVIPDSISVVSDTQVVVGFNTPIAGTAVVMRGETEGAPNTVLAFDQAFTNLSSWVVNHQLGYNPIVRVIIGTNEVQPQSIVYNSTMQLTVTFSSPQTGSVRCV
jgi:hypothetical protein